MRSLIMPTYWLYCQFKIIKRTLFRFCSTVFFLGASLFSTNTVADYMPQWDYTSYSYFVTFDANSKVARNPTTGTNGTRYYQVGDMKTVGGWGYTSEGVTNGAGKVKCRGQIIYTGPNGFDIPSNSSQWKKTVISLPPAGFSIGGVPAYNVSREVVMTISTSIPNRTWVKGTSTGSGTCSPPVTSNDTLDFSTLDMRIYLTFYIKTQTLDNRFSIGLNSIGSYTIAYTAGSNPPGTDANSSYMSPIMLYGSNFQLPAACTTLTSSGSASSLNLIHGSVSSIYYDSTVSGKITYSCRFTQNQPISVRLDYTQDNDPEKRLPLSNGNNKIYSTLTMTDETTGRTYAANKIIKMDIKDLSTITVTSHLEGSNAAPGNYFGSAWLISTFD